MSNVIQFKAPPRRLRPDVPPFDLNNPAHIAAWEALWDLGMVERSRQELGS